MSKLNKYLKSIAGGKAYKKACKKLMKNIAKECDNINLLSEADLNSVAGGGGPVLISLADLPPVNLRQHYAFERPEGGKRGFIKYTDTCGERVSMPTVEVDGVVYAIAE